MHSNSYARYALHLICACNNVLVNKFYSRSSSHRGNFYLILFVKNLTVMEMTQGMNELSLITT